VPILSSRITTTTSAEPRPPSAESAESLITRFTLGSSMLLSISAVAPLRSTTAVSGEAARPSVLLMPVASICTAAKMNTTRARPSTAAAVVVLRTARFRML
jgi:hypothetical protein